MQPNGPPPPLLPRLSLSDAIGAYVNGNNPGALQPWLAADGGVAAAGGALPPPGGMGALPGPGGSLMVAGQSGEDESMLDIGSVDGRVKASSIKKIGEIVDKHPDEAVAIIRSWMYQGT